MSPHLCAQVELPKSITEANYATIGLTSQYIDSPGSSFGHIFIIFHQNINLVLSSPTVSYAANVSNGDNLFNMTYKGLFGKYSGAITIAPLFKKIDEYRTKEQRDLYFYTLDLKKNELKDIIDRLSSMMNKDYSYYFLSKNCTFFAKQLLVSKDIHANFFEIPSQTISDFNFKYKSILLLPSNANQASFSFDQASKDEANDIETIIKDNGEGEIKPKELGVIENYYTYQYYKNNLFPTPLIKSKLALGNSKKFDYIAYPFPVHKKFTRLGITRNDSKELLINIRPFYRDEYDLLPISPEGRFNLFELKAEVSPKIKLENLTIVEIAQFPKFDKLFKRRSWDFRLDLSRENLTGSLATQFYSGIGYSIPIFSSNILGFTIGPKLNLRSAESYIAFQTEIFSFISFNSKSKLILKYANQIKKDKDLYRFESSLEREIMSNFYIRVSAGILSKNSYDREASLTLHYNI